MAARQSEGTRSKQRELARTIFDRGIAPLVRQPAVATAYWKCVARHARECGGQVGFAGSLPRIALDQLVGSPESIPVTIMEYQYVLGNLGINELIALCTVARSRSPETVFEIGTFLGATTLQLAANTSARVYTLDLAPRGHPEYVETDFWGQPDQPGERFRGSPFEERITQLFGNSQTYDFGPYAGEVDLVFVDASHRYEPVRADSLSALEMVSADGVIFWHDYGAHAPGVVRALEELGTEVPLLHLGGTSLVVHDRRAMS